MEFESAKQAAERMGVTVRAVQKWAKEGRLPGAHLTGKVWFVPKNISEPLKKSEAMQLSAINRLPLPLLRSSYNTGRVCEFIDSIPDEDDKNIALIEYYYYTGESEKVIAIADKYSNSEDESLRYSANLMRVFAEIFNCNGADTALAHEYILEKLEEGLKNNSGSMEIQAIRVLNANIAVILFDFSVTELPPLEIYMQYLPQGIRLYAAYLLGYKAYKEKNYERAIGICETALACCDNFYPIASVFVLIVAAASYMGLKKSDIAIDRFTMAWERAKDDGLIKIFGIHHNILQGLLEQCLKYDYPDDYRRIMRVAEAFYDGLYKFNKADEYNYLHILDPLEKTIGILYSHDWSVKEISVQLNLSQPTVKKYIGYIYDKLCITHKKALKGYFEE